MKDLDVALLQNTIASDSPAANLQAFAAQLADVGAVDLAVLPEVFTTGFHPQARQRAEVMNGDAYRWLQAQARQHQCALTGSVVMAERGDYVNRMLWADASGDVTYYDKRHLFRMAGEHKRYRAGARRVITNRQGWRFLLQVCYDLRFPVFSRNRGDYDCLIYVANWPAARHDHWCTLLKARAIENLSYVIGVNRVGVDAYDQDYAGGSAVFSPTGECLLDAGREVGVATATLSWADLQRYREHFPAHLDADEFFLSDQ